MLAFLQYLIAVLLSMPDGASSGPGAPPPDALGIIALISACGLVFGSFGVALAVLTRRNADEALGRFLFAQNAMRVVSLGAFWAISHPLGGRALPTALGVGEWPFLPHLVRVAPFFLLLGLAHASLHAAARQLGIAPPGLIRATVRSARQAVMPLMPVVVLLATYDALGAIVRWAPESPFAGVVAIIYSVPLVQVFVTLGMAFLAYLVAPFVLRIMWRAYPLPPGSLRTRLEAYAARIGLKARDILVWPSGGDYLNAAVVGPLPKFRYVVLTDGLIDALGEDEIEAVFAHEAGHARRGHILLFFGFTSVLILASLLPAGFGSGVAEFLRPIPPLIRMLLTILLWLGVVMGFISRRFEQEADVYGLETLPSPDPSTPPAMHPFPRAMERIADEVGGIREMTGWRHFSIADRVQFVHDYLSDPAVRARYRRNIRLLRWSLITVIAVFLGWAALGIPRAVALSQRIWQSQQAPASVVLDRIGRMRLARSPGERAQWLVAAAVAAESEDRHEEALRWLREAVQLSPENPVALQRYAAALERDGRPRGALLAWRDLASLEGAAEPLRALARKHIRSLEESTSGEGSAR